MNKKIEIPEGYEARIEGNNVIFEPKISEDERIRKGMLRHFRNKTKPYWNEIAVKDIIAYLEKQKEQKPNIVEKLREISTPADENWFEIQKRWEKEDEQKPAECLKAERDGWYVCIKDYYRGGRKRSSVGDLVQAKGGMHIMGEEDISEWFRKAYYEEVRDAFEHPEKSTEWSEGDSPYYDDICEILINLLHSKTADVNKDVIQKDLDWLLSLRPQPKQKGSEDEQKPIKVYDNMDDLIADAMIDEISKSDMSDSDKHNRVYWINKHRQKFVEWREEDEKMMRYVVGSLNPNISDFNFKNIRIWFESFKDRVQPKSHWKPSKEQMEWLESAVKLSTDKPRIHGTIVSLYEQLKRL